MSYVQHTHHDPGYGSTPGGYPSAVPPPPGFFHESYGPSPPPPPQLGLFSDSYAPPPPPPPRPSYQGYFGSDYAPPPPPQHISHQSWGYQDAGLCSSFLRTCMATLCCCCMLDQCCGRY